MGITVNEARELSDANKPPQNLDGWIKCIEGKIRSAAGRGEYDVIAPFSGVRMPSTPEVRKMAIEHFVSAGFTWYPADCRLSWREF